MLAADDIESDGPVISMVRVEILVNYNYCLLLIQHQLR